MAAIGLRYFITAQDEQVKCPSAKNHESKSPFTVVVEVFPHSLVVPPLLLAQGVCDGGLCGDGYGVEGAA